MITHGELIELGFERKNENYYQLKYQLKHGILHEIEVSFLDDIFEIWSFESTRGMNANDYICGECDSFNGFQYRGIKTIEDLKTLIRLCKGE